MSHFAGNGNPNLKVLVNGTAVSNDFVGTHAHSAHCPDLLRYEQIGEADGMRGRVVRAFFWLMRLWPPS